MKSICTIVIIFVLSLSLSFAANCFGPSSHIMVEEFSAFPSPVAPGETVFIRAKITPLQEIPEALVRVRVYYSESTNVDKLSPIVDIPGLNFCTLSGRYNCPLKATTSILTWDFPVPDILPGTYQILYNIVQTAGTNESASSCIQFSIKVAGDAVNNGFTSWYKAILIGNAVFTNPNYTARTVGHVIQVGFAGPLNGTKPHYGTVTGISGSGDLIPTHYVNYSGFIWGLTGKLLKKTYGATLAQQTHVYSGDCYLGYISGGYNYDYANPLITGTFTLTWSYIDSTTGYITGEVKFSPEATIPPQWGYPLLFGRLGTHNIETSEIGFLEITASKPFCAQGFCEDIHSTTSSSRHSDGVNIETVIIVVCVIGGVLIIAGLATAWILFLKRKKDSEQEDGVFAVARKPEYASALVVGDIIDETKENKALRSMLNRSAYSDEDEDSNEDEDDDDNSDRGSRSRSRSDGSDRSPSFSRSRSRTRSRSSSVSRGRSGRSGLSSGRIRSGETSDPGESASRSEEDYSEDR